MAEEKKVVMRKAMRMNLARYHISLMNPPLRGWEIMCMGLSREPSGAVEREAGRRKGGRRREGRREEKGKGERREESMKGECEGRSEGGRKLNASSPIHCIYMHMCLYMYLLQVVWRKCL